MNTEDLLQARLSLLESGKSLDTCLDGVPEEIAELLRLANSIRSLEFPKIDPQIASAQRSCLEKMSAVLYTHEEVPPIIKTPNIIKPFWLRWDRVALAFSTLVLLILCTSVTIGIGSSWLLNQNQSGILGNAPVDSRFPDEALLQDPKGLVEIFNNGQWSQAAKFKSQIKSGMHIRTASLSSTTISLADGSQIFLGPGTEIIFEDLDVQTSGSPRTVVLTQLSGISEHNVFPSKNKTGTYEVRTSVATGTALGTAFKVQVKPDESAWFSVSEGEVSVTGNNETVKVDAGETTIVAADESPTGPEYFFSGSGEISYVGGTWIVAGQVLVTHSGTTIIGNPQVGDQAAFEGRLFPDETKIVDTITLLHRSPANHFSIIGNVEKITDLIWTVNGQDIAVTDITVFPIEVLEGDLVQIRGLVLPKGILQAEYIQKMDEQPGSFFEFQGVVEEFSENEWTVSGLVIHIDDKTILDTGLISGDLVQASGWILEDNTWHARSILRSVDETRTFEFTGYVENLDPWKVAGVKFETREWTIVDEDISLDDLVNVSGQVMEDGTWVAYAIIQVKVPYELRFNLIGVVTSMQPWVVSGNTLSVDAETVISDEISLGMLVQVDIQVLGDGQWKIISILPVKGYSWGFGCHEIVAQLVNLADGQIQLLGWSEISINKEISLPENLEPNNFLLLQICFGENGSIQIASISLLYKPPIEEIENHEAYELPNEKVMICHKPLGKNPHTIVVSSAAVPAHLGHGDILGPCR